MTAAPLRHSEIRAASQHAPAGRTRISARRSDPLASGTPFSITAAELSAYAVECRFASGAFAVLANELEMKAGYPTFDSADRADDAFQLHKLARALDQLAQDSEALRILAHRAAGGSVECKSPLVVVGEEEHDAPASGHKLGVLARLTRRLGRLPAR